MHNAHPFLIVPWNQDLLAALQHILMDTTNGNTGDAVIIFPHSRPARHLVEQLRLADNVPKPCLLPRILTVQQLCSLMRAEIRPRPQRNIELLDRVGLLLDCVKELSQSDIELYQQLTKGGERHFFPWGVRLASLMEEFFTQNSTPRNMPLMEGEVSAFAAALLGSLEQIYARYMAALDARGWTTTGLDALRAAQNLHALPKSISQRTVIMAGFATLSGTEEAIFKHLWQENGGRIVLHTDPAILTHEKAHWTCEDHSKWIASWQAQAELACVPTDKKPHIDFCEGYDVHSQLHELSTILNTTDDLSHSAIVLPDTSLLMPVLHHIPEKEVNISMGYPLSRSTLFRLLETLMRLQESRAQTSNKESTRGLYHWRPCIDLIRHPYLKMLSIKNDAEASGYERPLVSIFHTVEDQVRRGSRFVNLHLLLEESLKANLDLSAEAQDLGQAMLFACLDAWEDATSPAGIATAMSKLCALLIDHGGDLWKRFPIDAECLYRLMERVIPALQDCDLKDHIFSQDVLFTIVRETIRTERVPFEADPIGGLQVLGMLESRLLHFKRIIVLDATDDALPGSAAHDPLLPDSLRPELGLPNAYRRERVTAHNFHRLLASADHITLLWQHSATATGLLDNKKSRSRFVEELIWNEEQKQGKLFKPGDGSLRAISCTVKPAETQYTKVVKTEAIQERLMSFLEKPLSPSRLNVYLQCPFRFFHQYICGIKAPDEVLENDDPAGVGDLLHKVLFDFYKPYIGRRFSRETCLESLHGKNHNAESAFDAHIERINTLFFEHLAASPLQKQLPADSLVMLQIAGPLRLRLYLEQQEPSTIVSLESDLLATIDVGTHKQALQGRIDRIDSRDGLGHIILDYKTGNITSKPAKAWLDHAIWDTMQTWLDASLCTDSHTHQSDIIDGADEILKDLSKLIPSVQMPCYLYAYQQKFPQITVYDAAFIGLRESGNESMLFGKTINEDEREEALHERIPLLLRFLIQHLIKSPSFKACEGKHCDWCSYSNLCKG